MKTNDFKVADVRKIIFETYIKLRKLKSKNKLKNRWKRKLSVSLLSFVFFYKLDKKLVNNFEPLDYRFFISSENKEDEE